MPSYRGYINGSMDTLDTLDMAFSVAVSMDALDMNQDHWDESAGARR